MAFFKGKFSSNKQEWATPIDLFKKIDEEFHFTLDLAADCSNTKCEKYFSEKDDSLKQNWDGVCWLNPPYGSKEYKLENWIKKAYNESLKENNIIVMLIPARTNTKWWHKYCMTSSEIKFICGRPKFGDAKHGLPQPLALIVFKNHDEQTIFSSFYIDGMRK